MRLFGAHRPTWFRRPRWYVVCVESFMGEDIDVAFCSPRSKHRADLAISHLRQKYPRDRWALRRH